MTAVNDVVVYTANVFLYDVRAVVLGLASPGVRTRDKYYSATPIRDANRIVRAFAAARGGTAHAQKYSLAKHPLVVALEHRGFTSSRCTGEVIPDANIFYSFQMRSTPPSP